MMHTTDDFAYICLLSAICLISVMSLASSCFPIS
jgi:hypothetical protein